MSRRLLFAPLLLALACKGDSVEVVDSEIPPSDSAAPADLDGDGSPAGEDCDDERADVFPGAEERCDGVDNDCDGTTDAGATDASAWYNDGDADGFGAGEATLACEAPAGAVAQDGDCDDNDAAYNPAASETDCADPNDYNCDGSVGYADNDGDGYPACQDCDDADAAFHPGISEICDGADNDCDGLTDDADDSLDPTTRARSYQDADSDGYGDIDFFTDSCVVPEGYVSDSADCDDGQADVNPAAAEVCNGLDDDCDALVDDADDGVDTSTGATFYADGDGDGFGDADRAQAACAQPSGFVSDQTDCDDADAAINPDADEVCNSVDDDCDALVDDADGDVDSSAGAVYYADVDGDGFGDPSAGARACAQPASTVRDDDDCDDGDAGVNPDAVEDCDGVDDDCDGDIDDPDALLGSAAACPAVDCLDAATTLSAPSSGLHWIDPTSSGAAYEAYCDMSTDGGGWSLVMRCVADYIDYDDTAWTTTALLDESVIDFTAPGCSKYEAFNSVSFTELRSSSTTDLTDDYVETFSSGYTSALTLFSGTGFQISTTYQSYFNDMMDPFGREWGCTSYRSYGINQRDYLGTAFISGGSYCDWNGGARWGQRVNANHSGTGNHAGQGWGVYSTIGYQWSWAISQLMWVR